MYAVLDGLQDDPVKLAVYVAAFAVGLFLGMVFEEKLDMGDTVWVYLGQTHVSYCLYWKQ